ncbi:MAG: hypothetical protein JWP75_1876 [Frondihabitans sp.]|nr:hypothetical protein [Frondihabitans sp.]
MTSDELPTFTPDEIESDLAALAFDSFDQEAAYALGTLAAELVRERELTLSVQIVIGDHIVYKAALGGVPEGTTEWLRRKSNVAKAEGVPSLLVRLREESGDTRFSDKGLDEADHAVSGGSFPIVVDGDVVGTLTLSGEPDVVDHSIAVAALRSYLAN